MSEAQNGGIVLTGGGTGGHVYPALAVAEALAELAPGLPIRYVGTPDRFESQAVPAAKLPFHTIPSSGLTGGALGAAKALFLAATGAWKARRMLKQWKAQAVLATGGFVCVPVLLAARSLGIPYVLAEQNAVPGKVNRLFAKGAAFVALSLEASAEHFPHGAQLRLMGNPLRAQVIQADGPAWRQQQGIPKQAMLLVASGGSQGAAALNQGLALALPALMEAFPHLHVVWATGSKEEGPRRQEAAPYGQRIRIASFLPDLPEAMAAADLVLGRAGATSLAEITALGKAAVLIPYPHAGAHQAANAHAAEAAGAVRTLPDAMAKEGALGPLLMSLLGDEAQLAHMAQASLSLGRPHAAQELAQALLALQAKSSTKAAPRPEIS